MAVQLPMRPMGKQGLVTSMQGFGCMGITAFYGTALEDDKALEVLEKAYSLGVRHFDSAEVYAGKDAAGNPKHNEEIVGKFMQKVKASDPTVSFATKYFPNPAEGKEACTPEQVREAVDASLKRLGLDCIDLYYLHRVPSDEAAKSFMETGKKLVEEGKIKYLGISEATPAEIRAAHAIHPLTAVQQEWSLVVRSLEADIVPTCRELGIAIVAYSPLCRGLTSGLVKSDADWAKIGNEGGAASGFQAMCPHLTGENLAQNVKLLEPLEAAAADLKVTPAELSLAWVQAQGEDVFPIPGTTKVANLEKNVAAAHLACSLPKETIDKIGPSAALAGDRYPEGMNGMSFEARMKA